MNQDDKISIHGLSMMANSNHTDNGKAPGDITTFADFVKPEYF